MAHCMFKKNGASTGTGTGKYAHGTFTTNTSTTTKVTLGFKPKSLAIKMVTYMYFYDDAVSTTQFKYAASNAYMSNVNLGNTSNDRLGTIDNDGFTFNKTGAVYTCYYHAVGE